MASIKSQMTLNDGMSATINRITKSLQTLTGSFIAMQQASANGVDTQNFEAANAALVRQINLAEQLANEFSNVADETERTRKNIEDSTDKTENLMGKVKKVVATLGLAAGAKKLIELSDQQASNTARLSLLVDDGGSVSEVEDMIFASAMRSRSAYQDTMSTVAKLGMTAADAFSDASGKLDFEQVIGFTELLNKNFVIGGASASEQAAAMYQLTQAMSSGRLQGDEYKSIIENAPMLAASIEDYMRNVAGAEGSMKDWAAQGLLTADVIKAAVFSTAGDVDDAFGKIPLTWGQVWTMAQNIILKCLDPVLTAINWFANNLSIIGPLVAGIGAAFIIFQIAAHWTEIASAATAVYNFVLNLLSIGYGIMTGNATAASAAVFAFTKAQTGANGALIASPITWYLMVILILIAAFYAIIAVINKFAKKSYSATGIIAGLFAVLFAHIYNGTVVPLWNAFASIANFLGNVFNNPIGAIKVLFLDFALTSLGYVRNLAEGIEKLINKIPGITVDITSGLDSFYAGLEEAQKAVKDETGWVEYVQKKDFIDYGNAANAGYNFGKGIEDKIGGMFGGGDGFNYDELMGNVGAINENTDVMAGSLDVSNEQLEYLRDIAEREAVNRFTTAEVKIDMTGMTNKISGSADLDGVISGLTEGFAASLLTAAEGVPA